ncbi:MAG: S41 family peptidase [Chloroflexota bacterium]
MSKQWMRVILIVPIVALIFSVGFFAGATHLAILAQEQDTQPANTQKLFAPFWETWNLVHENYVDPIDDEKLMEGAASGMVAALGDRHSAYMNPDLFKSLNSDLSGQFEGIGATIRKDDKSGGIFIVSTIADSPARQGGIKSGDIILTVDGKDITTLTESDFIGKVRGPAGSAIKLGVLHKGAKRPIDITLTRAAIKIPVVTWTLYQNKIGYVRLAEFTDNAIAELRKALTDMDANHLNGLIFDLRDNPGGGLQTAIDVGSLFIKNGPLVLERGKPGTQENVLSATGNALAPDVPMVVLINGGSASASELVSGALQDYKRATLVGTLSFGKGSVQSWRGLQAGGGLRITIAHFFTPKDRIIHEIGLTPDVVLPWDTDASPTYDPQMAEALQILRGEF